MRPVHPIERESYRRLRAAVDLSGLPPLSRAVAERVIHASGDLGYAEDLVLDEAALRQGLAALRAGAPVVVDTRMVAAGIPGMATICGLDLAAEGDDAGGPAPTTGSPTTRAGGPVSRGRLDLAPLVQAEETRSAAGIRAAAARAGPGAVYVVGCAPTALEALLGLDARPVLVVGLPVGFVGAVEAKQALRASGLPAASNRSPRGGAAVAAAALNALRYREGQ